MLVAFGCVVGWIPNNIISTDIYLQIHCLLHRSQRCSPVTRQRQISAAWLCSPWTKPSQNGKPWRLQGSRCSLNHTSWSRWRMSAQRQCRAGAGSFYGGALEACHLNLGMVEGRRTGSVTSAAYVSAASVQHGVVYTGLRGRCRLLVVGLHLPFGPGSSLEAHCGMQLGACVPRPGAGICGRLVDSTVFSMPRQQQA